MGCNMKHSSDAVCVYVLCVVCAGCQVCVSWSERSLLCVGVCTSATGLVHVAPHAACRGGDEQRRS